MKTMCGFTGAVCGLAMLVDLSEALTTADGVSQLYSGIMAVVMGVLCTWALSRVFSDNDDINREDPEFIIPEDNQ